MTHDELQAERRRNWWQYFIQVGMTGRWTFEQATEYANKALAAFDSKFPMPDKWKKKQKDNFTTELCPIRIPFPTKSGSISCAYRKGHGGKCWSPLVNEKV